ncbi:MAG: leucine-rich repeat domain-containing protein [Oscillospiraceae bacterium]|nr:leucine-rich repeat domain-containing protein [Oscillospiraceae bacterium]
MKKKSNTGRILVLLVLILILAAAVAGMVWFLNNHFFLEGHAYPNDAKELDLRSEKLTVAEYEALRAQLPGCRIAWNVPFQGVSYPDDTESITISSLSAEDLDMLVYLPGLRSIDAAGCRDYDMLMQLQRRYPDIALSYSVNIGGVDYPHTATNVVATDLSEEEIALFAYLPQLQTVDANACTDAARLAEVARNHTEVKLIYQVELLGQTFNQDTVSATFKDPDIDELIAHLPGLTGLQELHIVEPTCDAGKLRQLMEENPDVTITWDKTVLGKTFNSGETEYDLSDLALSSTMSTGWKMEPMDAAQTAAITQMVEEAMIYFPNAEKVILPAYYFDNETMSAFREKMRPEYKVVWTVYITRKPVRTDQEIIHSSALKVCFIDEQSYDLKYCEDAVIVDIGHSYVKYIEWVRYMPNLKYLILTHNWIKDLSPISSCKNLVYLEIYWNQHIPDYSPLLGCTALKDLNLSGTYADPTPLQQMTWLENLWANATDFTSAEKQALVDALPNTHIEFNGGGYTTLGWRQLQSYYDMRDMMGLPYNTW